LKVRAKRLDEYPTLGRFLFTHTVEYDDTAVRKHLNGSEVAETLRTVLAAFDALGTFDPVAIEEAVRSVADARGVKAATVIHALRVAMTGKTVSPGLFDILSLLGREQVGVRIRAAIDLASAPVA